MYLAIDVGGTKTLFAVFDQDGRKLVEHRILTPEIYSQFLKAIRSVLENELRKYTFSACCCALPGRLDRQKGVAIRFGNLPWQNVPVKADLKRLLGGGVPLFIENDAKLAGLSEALLIQKRYKKVLYITIGTGLGGAVIINGILDKNFLDMEPGRMFLEHDGRQLKWEAMVSGRAMKRKYGKLASEIEDPSIWRDYVKELAIGIEELCANLTPEVVIIGGGVGAHFDKFGAFLKEELKKYDGDLVTIPPVLEAKRPEEAVIYGCYEYIRQNQ